VFQPEIRQMVIDKYRKFYHNMCSKQVIADGSGELSNAVNRDSVAPQADVVLHM